MRGPAHISMRTVAPLMAAALLLVPLVAEAQQPGKLPRIGILSPTLPPPPLSPNVEELLKGLRELGYENGKTATIEIRYGADSSERLAEQAAELVRLKVDVICATGDLATSAAQRTTKTVPIVSHVGFPVESGFVASLARPGGNTTAVSTMQGELVKKRLELLKQAVPTMTRVALLFDPVLNELQVRMAEAGSKSLGLQLQVVQARAPAELPAAFEAAARGRSEGMVVVASNMMLRNSEAVVALAAKHRIPTFYPFREYVDAGGLMSYGANLAETLRLAAAQADRILKGAKPAELPVRQASRFDLTINLKTARALALDLPQTLVQRADQVIE